MNKQLFKYSINVKISMKIKLVIYIVRSTFKLEKI